MERGVREKKHNQRGPRGVTGEGRMESVFVGVVKSKEKGMEGRIGSKTVRRTN